MELTGIALSDRKRYLVMARLARRLRELSLSSYDEYVDRLGDSRFAATEVERLVNAITTNETSFFRESHQFDLLVAALPELVQRATRANRRVLRVWSAACSTGEEPYTLAMVLSKAIADHRGMTVQIMATDIDTDVLAKARAGRYTDDRLQRVPSAYVGSFVRDDSDRERPWRIREDLQRLVTFKRLNLIYDPFQFRDPNDVVFVRNVLIYFNEEGQHRVVSKIHGTMEAGGLVFVGSSESLLRERRLFKFRKNAVYEVLP